MIIETTPKMEQMGKPSAFYTYGVLGNISIRGLVSELRSQRLGDLDRRYASFKFQEHLYQIDLCPASRVYHEIE